MTQRQHTPTPLFLMCSALPFELDSTALCDGARQHVQNLSPSEKTLIGGDLNLWLL